MSGDARAAIGKLARRIANDATSATTDDARKLARAVLMLLGEKR